MERGDFRVSPQYVKELGEDIAEHEGRVKILKDRHGLYSYLLTVKGFQEFLADTKATRDQCRHDLENTRIDANKPLESQAVRISYLQAYIESCNRIIDGPAYLQLLIEREEKELSEKKRELERVGTVGAELK